MEDLDELLNIKHKTARKPISLKLPEDLLEDVEKLIKAKKIKSRQNLIESLLSAWVEKSKQLV